MVEYKTIGGAFRYDEPPNALMYEKHDLRIYSNYLSPATYIVDRLVRNGAGEQVWSIQYEVRPDSGGFDGLWAILEAFTGRVQEVEMLKAECDEKDLALAKLKDELEETKEILEGYKNKPW